MRKMVKEVVNMETCEKSEKEKLCEAKKMIKNYALMSVGAGLVPIPLVDMVALTGLQLKLLSGISRIYNIKFSKSVGKSIIGSLLGGFLPVTVSTPFGSLLKAIPVIGQTVGAVSMSLLGGATTYAIGKVFLQHFASGGTFLDFDPEKVRTYFAEQFQEGKKVSSDLV